MRELMESDIERADAHHRYTYEYGKKKEIPESGVAYLYKDKYGLLHATHWEDIAAGYGKYIITDEVEEKEGLPFVNGSVYTIFGAGEGYVYLTKNKNSDAKFHTVRTVHTVDKNSAVVPQGKELKRASCELLRQMYILLDAADEASNE
ncbi:MAG: hypothetical protein VB119_11365 [Candidatus Metalachnospira sp.]|nr:hypothetical protein [Candidatus Metalachnospira sp.]